MRKLWEILIKGVRSSFTAPKGGGRARVSMAAPGQCRSDPGGSAAPAKASGSTEERLLSSAGAVESGAAVVDTGSTGSDHFFDDLQLDRRALAQLAARVGGGRDVSLFAL